MKLRGISFRHAVELLHADPALVVQSGASGKARTRTLPAPVAFDVDDRLLLRQTIDYYHATLKQSLEALAYLEARGLNHPELIERFRLGYANRTLGLRLPEKTRKAGADIRSRLERIGIYRTSGHEHLNGSIVVPVFDAAGDVAEVYGRKINDYLRKGTPLHLYLPGPHRGVWNVEALAASKEIILCEALIDAMTFWCAGYRNVTSSYGVEGFTDDHLAAFKAHGTERVLIAYDRDEAGDRAAAALAVKLMDAGIDCYRILFPQGMDANAYAAKVQPAAKSLGLLIRKAQWMGQGREPARDVEAAVAEPVLSLAATVLEPTVASALPAPPSPPLPAAVMPPAPVASVDAEVRDHETVLAFGERRYRVRGLPRNLAYEVLKVNVLASKGDAFHVDTLDLYNARARQSFVAQAAIELGLPEETIKTDLGRVLLKLETLQDEQIQGAVRPKEVARAPMPQHEQEAALDLLRSPDLVQRIVAGFEACGIVGEATNKLVGYLAATSRRLDAPLAVVIQSSSAAGKSSLMDAVLAMMPEEERVKYSAMTGQSLFYMGETNLKHKILAIVEEEGASRASYALKLLQSEGELTIASTGSDPKTGNLVTQEYRVEGPVMMFLTTTVIDIDEELMNRCLVLTVDEDREQTRAIHRLQREKRTLQGLQRKEQRQHILDLHRNAQRLLRKLAVVNPYAAELTFLDDRTRTRRDHEKYLTLIDTIALLHQYQRPVLTTKVGNRSVDYIEATLDDIALANRLAHEVLGRSLDELPPQTRRVLAALHRWVEVEASSRELRRQDVRFSRTQVRQATALSDTQARIHLDRLIAMDYVLVHRGTRGQSFEYELLYDGQGQEGGAFVPGLIATEALRNKATTASSRGSEAGFAGPSRPGCGTDAAAVRERESGSEPATTGVVQELPPSLPTERLDASVRRASYLQPVGPSLAA
jgi:hypothetical protein